MNGLGPRLLILFFAWPVFADVNIRHGLEFVPQYRHLNQEGFSERNAIVDGFAMFNSHIEWSSGHWLLDAKPEIRAVLSPGVGETAPDGVSVATSQRSLNSRRTLFFNDDNESYFDFDRLYLSYRTGVSEVFVGRKPVSLGVLRFFPVWNKLTLPLIFQPGPEWIENPDALGASIQLGRFAYRSFWSRGNQPKVDDIAVFETRFFGDDIELQGLVGYWWEHSALGIAGAFDALQSTLRFETLWFSRDEDEVSQLQAGIGIERALDAKWTLVSEALYQSAGLSDLQNVLSPPNRFMVLSGKFYVLPYVTYQIHPLWTLNAGFLAGLSNQPSYVALAGFEHSLSDTTSLTLKIKWPFGASEGEFGDQRLSDPFQRRLGMSSTALLYLQSTF